MNQKQELALTLWYAYECIYTCNIRIARLSTKGRHLFDLQEALGYYIVGTTLYDIEEEIQKKFNLTLSEYWRFKESDHPLKNKTYDILFKEEVEVDLNAKHVSNIAGITGKGDLSKKSSLQSIKP